ncbi:MAG: glycosyltransferase [Rhodoferax sp.]|uniref:glycosyltransferase family 2 protein n=1 Tax=Rhodoferax sp. TaxID=50421 RepID=UPI002628D0BB|nr:glycosyltransferase [Rhodoferax sp.]MDD5333373.1 glycosyltransferase [Rhodoferax sp.]
MMGRTGNPAAAPLVSVLLPVFNAERYVEAALQSILNQTFGNFECIVIDDGSTDATLRILEQFQQKDERVVLVSRENKGLVDTLNEGIKIARGEWIARMDADDIALPNRLEVQLAWIERTGADICGSWVRFFGAKDKRVLRHPLSDQAIRVGLMFGTMFAHPTVLMRTGLAKRLLYDKQWEKCEDYDLWTRAAQLDCRMTNVPEVLLLYRQHPRQVSNRESSCQQELTQNIRLRHSRFIFGLLKLNTGWADEIVKLRDPRWPPVNMNIVDRAFTELLRHHQGEARAVILDHLTRLYYRVAAQCPDALQRWGRLNDEFGTDFSLGVRIRIWLLSTLRIRPGSEFFARMKSLYLGSER